MTLADGEWMHAKADIPHMKQNSVYSVQVGALLQKESENPQQRLVTVSRKTDIGSPKNMQEN